MAEDDHTPRILVDDRQHALVDVDGLVSLASACLAGEGAGRSELSLSFVTVDEIADLHLRYMREEGSTDVLSFPLLPPEAYPDHAGKATAAAGPGGAMPFPLPPGVRTHLGDIVVSVERALEQAAAGRGGQTGDVRWEARDELRLLVTHWTLHVCGCDHAEPAEEAAMRALERELLASASD